MMRTYRHSGQYANDGKVEQILTLAREYKVYYNYVVKKAIAAFFRDPQLPKFLPTYPVSALSERYRQTCGSQVKANLKSWLGNISNRVKDLIAHFSLSGETKKRLFTINKMQLWFAESLTLKGKEVSAEELKLCRKMFKRVQGRKPEMKHPSMLLDRKVATVEKSKKEGSFFGFWVKLSTLIFRKQVFIPLKSYNYYQEKPGIEQNAVQVIVHRDRVDISLVKDIEKAPNTEKSGEIGVDLGVLNLITTSTGHRYGTTLFPLLKKYDRLIQNQTKGRMRRGLMKDSSWLEELHDKVRCRL